MVSPFCLDESVMEEKMKGKKWLLIFFGISVGILLVGKLYHDFQPQIQMLIRGHFTQAELIKSVRSHGLEDGMVLIGLTAIMYAIPGLSSSIVCIFNGLCYGPVLGTTINWIGNLLGNILVWMTLSQIKLSDRTKKSKLLDDLLQFKYPMMGLILGYMIPFIPSFLVNFAATQMKVKFSKLMGVIGIGILPSAVIYAVGGDAILKGDNQRAVIVISCIVILVGLYVIIRKKRKIVK